MPPLRMALVLDTYLHSFSRHHAIVYRRWPPLESCHLCRRARPRQSLSPREVKDPDVHILGIRRMAIVDVVTNIRMAMLLHPSQQDHRRHPRKNDIFSTSHTSSILSRIRRIDDNWHLDRIVKWAHVDKSTVCWVVGWLGGSQRDHRMERSWWQCLLLGMWQYG